MVWTQPRDPESLPARLHRRRIYVLPTRFGMFYAFALLTMLAGALNYNNNPALLLGMLLGGAGLASLIAAQMQLADMELVAAEAEPVAAGTPMALRLHARANPGRARRGVRLDDDGAFDAEPAVLSLDKGVGDAQLLLPTQRRGWLDLPRLRLSTTRPLGLARAWAYVWPESPLLVYPAPEAHGPPLPTGHGDSAQARLNPAGDDVHHLRGYRAGDSRRAIAWKPSARRDALIVREFEQPMGAEVVLDWHTAAGVPYEGRISRLARWIDEAEREGRRYQLRLPGQPALGPDRGPAHRHACLRALALMPHV
ncbi:MULTISPECIES: DUF58 domain-containing protein [unclassified Lysobacter]|uniref:DUF58 domain-containing protein n=1 Tax=unclassified Lysobacter TaxID=2635362 RepID=UPI001C241711|nr:DUF58 domain-containing protein [Lysobacter sp. MMG2]MBU8976255.1 DUF58 domain-containing protein [Lysobacter sp. MMG2]